MGKADPFFPQGWAGMERGFFARTPRLLSLDFDGTLSEIAPTPASAWMSEDFRSLLWELSSLPDTRVVLLSGRSVPDLKKKIRLPGIVYVGNHGMDFSPPSAGWGIQALRKWTEGSKRVQERLKPLVQQWPGVLLETKGPDLSLHYRALNPQRVKAFIPEALKSVQGLPVLHRQGKCVLEFKPENAPGKGEALIRVADRFFGSKYKGVCLHIGDDQTDEDAFRALRGMGRKTLGLKVGPEPTKAHYRLKGIKEVYRFLSLFLEEDRN